MRHFLLTALLLGTSISSSYATPSKSSTSIVSPDDKVTTSYEVFAKEYKIDKSKGCYLRFHYPTIKGLKNLIQQQRVNDLLLEKGSQLETYKKEFHKLSTQEGFCGNNQTRSSAIITMEQKFEVVYQGPRVLSLLFHTFEFTGGAHPNSYPTNLVIDPELGTELTIDSFLSSNYLPALNEVLIKRLEVMLEKRTEQKDVKNFLFFDGFKDSKEIVFTASPKGLVIYFGPATAAAYAFGEFDVLLSWDELDGYIASSNPFFA